MTNEFEKNEEIGRNELLEYLSKRQTIKQVIFSNDKYSPEDGVIITNDDKKIMFELKKRDCNSNKYYDVFMELNKFNKLKELKPKYNVTEPIIYINLFNDGKCLIWNEKIIQNSKVRKRLMNKKTSVLNREKVLKDVILLPIHQAIVLNKI